VTFAVTVLTLLAVLNLTLGNKNVDVDLSRVAAVSDPEFVRSIGALLGPPVVGRNQAVALINGDQIFPAMLEAIRGARRSITFETYIYWSGTIGQEFAQALMERARAGVAVHVLVDWWGGEDIWERYRRPMAAAGVRIELYNPPRPGTLGRLNARTHRKLMVVDGSIGFTGGAGIADPWLGDGGDPAHWRDTHFEVRGPVVAQLQAAFMDNWTSASGEVLHGSDYFPALSPAGHQDAQLFTSAAGGGAESIQLMYLMSIAGARRSLRLSMAYFVPDELAQRALVEAARRGVRVQIVLPGEHIDRELVRRASRSRWGPLLRAGVEIYEYQPTMYHCKMMIVDEVWTSVGSTNFDNRSFVINDEANLNVHDTAFAGIQVVQFEADRALARRVTLADWQARPWHDRLLDDVAGVLRSQL
jgi:cardiolipin synthase